MPTQEAPDDIFALFSRFDLDMSQYRVFERENLVHPAIAAPEPELPTEMEAETVEAITVPGTIKENHPVVVARAELADRTASRTGLANLQRSLRSRETASSPQGRVAVPVSVSGVAGGVGVTTIAATLARQLSKDGRCGLYDNSPESLLPLYFGNQQIATHHHRFAGLHSVLGPAVRFLSLAMCEAAEDSTALALSASEKIARHFENEFDHIIFDAARETSAPDACLKIHVAIPDVSSVAGIKKLLGRKEGQQPAHQAICVLNRFDRSLALHQELRSWYEDHFEEVVTIDNSPLVAEALAEGVTVLDWAPEADASGDFIRLANAIRRSGQKMSSSVSNSKNQPEGLALCS